MVSVATLPCIRRPSTASDLNSCESNQVHPARQDHVVPDMNLPFCLGFEMEATVEVGLRPRKTFPVPCMSGA